MNQMKIQLRQISAATSEATLRTHRVLIDRPEDKGGADAGPMGGELFLVSAGECFMSNLPAAISARKANISEVRTDIIGTLAEAPTRFSAVELQVIARGSGKEIRRLVEVADRGCIMMSTLRGKLDLCIHTVVAK
jgi:putative redox protein